MRFADEFAGVVAGDDESAATVLRQRLRVLREVLNPRANRKKAQLEEKRTALRFRQKEQVLDDAVQARDFIQQVVQCGRTIGVVCHGWAELLGIEAHQCEWRFQFVRGVSRETLHLRKRRLKPVKRLVEQVRERRELIIAGRHWNTFAEIVAANSPGRLLD